jgi:gluconate 2-dehydrogenase alpha chain
MAERTDAIVVGLGAVGGIIAEQLARAGVKVTALDKGPHYPKDYFRFKHDEIRYYSTQIYLACTFRVLGRHEPAIDAFD